jgi:hypothetical protein
MPLGPSCLHRPVSVESGSMEITTQVRGAPAPEINLNLVSSPVPLRERVHSLMMSLLGLALSCLCQPLFLNVGIPMQGLERARSSPWGSRYPRKRHGGWPNTPTMNGCTHRGKGDGWRVTQNSCARMS